MNLASLINHKGFTLEEFASASGLPETRLNAIIFGGKFSCDEYSSIMKALGMTPSELYQALGKAPCDVFTRHRERRGPGKIIDLRTREELILT